MGFEVENDAEDDEFDPETWKELFNEVREVVIKRYLVDKYHL